MKGCSKESVVKRVLRRVCSKVTNEGTFENLCTASHASWQMSWSKFSKVSAGADLQYKCTMESTFQIFLEEEAHVTHHRGVAPHGSRITKRDLLLLKQTHYYLEEEAHALHQCVVAAHCSCATEAPSTPLMQQKSLAVVNSSCKCPTASRKPHVPQCTTATPTQPRRKRSKP